MPISESLPTVNLTQSSLFEMGVNQLRINFIRDVSEQEI